MWRWTGPCRRHGSVFDVFSSLVSIPAMLAHPNLTLDVVLTVEEELRELSDRPGRWRRGWARVDRRLVDVVETHTIASMADLFAMIDAELPELFTSNDIAVAMKSGRRLGQKAAYCFREGGVSEVCDKNGNALVYRRGAERILQRITSCICSAISGGREKVIVLAFLTSFLVINYLTICHRPSYGQLSNEVLSWRPETRRQRRPFLAELTNYSVDYSNAV